MDPGKIRELFEREGRDGAFVTFADPFKGEVVAVGIQRVGEGESIETRLRKAPQESVGLKIERGPFAIGVRPSFRPPNDVKPAGIVVSDGVGAVIGGELDCGFRGGVCHNRESRPCW